MVKKPLTEQKKQTIRNLFQKEPHLSNQEIAERLNDSTVTIHQIHGTLREFRRKSQPTKKVQSDKAAPKQASPHPEKGEVDVVKLVYTLTRLMDVYGEQTIRFHFDRLVDLSK